MTSALVFLNGSGSALPLVEDLKAAGIEVVGSADTVAQLLSQTLRHAPDVVVCDAPHPGDALFHATQAIGQTSPRPVIVFTSDVDAEHMARATESGVHAYVVNGYGAHRLRPLIHLAQARFKHEQGLREALADVSSRFEERKMVDRAKGILMRARQLSDDEAFQILRTASMHSNQRLGQVSEHIIHSAHFADAVNRAGQLRMLSQRLIKQVLLQVAGGAPAPLQDSVGRIDANLALLGKNLSKPTFGDLLGQVVVTWKLLKKALQAGPQAGQLKDMDALAETLLQSAERLTSNLENAGAVAPLRVLNVAGRQRMLSQRYAKCALQRDQAGMAEARAAMEQGLAYLNSLPLSTPDIRSALAAATEGWQQMLAGASEAAHPAGQERIAVASERLLEVYEQLSAHYERSMQMLVG
ncbi:MAG: type IV pili methyl-accepting chemotaxis transducer N-terminal domain-containing protein [Rhodoferax sp.]|nr:type IV pili methyl-accepting chemotaxis transducer N-terminal domain-containing protein [Rhodoferax sp.]MDP3655300.1 type IV pili methyl-accepting chemotaxis transducer N-terminal domain-containing protein [Rhodoferax sp.]